MSIVVVATIRPLPESRDELRALFEETVPEVHEEEGCELYALHEAEDRFVVIEKWASRETLAAHAATPTMREVGARRAGWIAGPPEVVVLDAIPAGTAGKGAL